MAFVVAFCQLAAAVPADAANTKPAAAPPVGLQLMLPVDCDMQAVCSIQNYVDADPGAGARDYLCGTLTYDGHQGTDFQLPDRATMRRGVAVLAAAAGTVRNIRDGVPDLGFEYWQRTGNEENALGNGVAIVHPDGSETLYGHLRQGSISVVPGERVVAGQPIGLVGVSGKTQFPHLHFQLMRDGRAIDPFAGAAMGAGCELTGVPLWSADALARLAYRPAVMVCGGFALAVPDRAAIQDACPSVSSAAADSEAIILFTEISGVQAGDRLRLTVRRPDGSVLVDNEFEIAKARARQFRYVGKKRPEDGWPPGSYAGRIVLTRDAPPDRRVPIDISRSLVLR